MHGLIWKNGAIESLDAARVAATDRGFMLGDGVFESLRSYGGSIFALDKHLSRLHAGMRTVGIPISRHCRANVLADACRQLCSRTAPDSYFRIVVTRGEGRFGVSTSGLEPNAYIICRPYAGYAEELYERGARVIVASVRRWEKSALVGVKSLSFLELVMARRQAEEAGADEALVCNSSGRVAEATTSNVFTVFGDTLRTPPVSEGLLPGITRSMLMNLAPELGFDVEEVPLSVEDLLSADEVFLTNSLAEVLPVASIDGRATGKGKIAGELRRAYRELACGRAAPPIHPLARNASPAGKKPGAVALEVITFDAFGTLLDIDSQAVPAVAEFMAREGMDTSPAAELSREWTKEFLACYRLASGRSGNDFVTLRAITEEALERVLEARGMRGDAGLGVDVWFGRIAGADLFDDVVPALELLAERFRLAVISDADNENLPSALQGYRLPLEAVFTSESAGVYKLGPGGGLFTYAAGKLGVAPSKILHVGDMESDVTGAVRAGMRGVRLDRSGRGEALVSGSETRRVRDLLEFAALVSEL